jgi:hypothetical protein
MLSHPRVEPEHLLLATPRRGRAERLLPADAARAIHDAIVQINGFGEKLELRPRRSPASEQVLSRAVTAGHERGFVSPSSQHLLLALGEHELPARILAELDVSDVETLVDTEHARSPVDSEGDSAAVAMARGARLHTAQPRADSPDLRAVHLAGSGRDQRRDRRRSTTRRSLHGAGAPSAWCPLRAGRVGGDNQLALWLADPGRRVRAEALSGL